MKKKLLAIFLCLVMIVTALPTMSFTALATGSTCDHQNAVWTDGDGTDNRVMTCTCGTITFVPWTDAMTNAANVNSNGLGTLLSSGNYYLSKDISINSLSLNNVNVNIDLNGYTIDLKALKTDTAVSGNKLYGLFSVYSNATLSIYDSSVAKSGRLTRSVADSSTASMNARCLRVDETSSINMYGGTITGFGAEGYGPTVGAAVHLQSGGKFNMYGGTIANCTATQNGGAINNRGTVTIYGGVITNCIGIQNGGAIYNEGSAVTTIYGGTIESCASSNGRGGAVAVVGGSVAMRGGTVDNCSAWQGGGFYVTSTATLNVYGGRVSGCTATKWNTSDSGGGAVIRASANANVSIYGGEFIDNFAVNDFQFRFAEGGTGSFVISGGAFSSRPDSDFITIADGYSLSQEGDVWKVKEKADWVQSGASVRITNPTGIRFVASIPKSEVGNNDTYGMLISPTEYVLSVSEFTKAALDASAIEGTKYVDINSSDNGFAVDTTGEYYTFNGVLTNIADYFMEFSAIAYVRKSNGEYIYSNYNSYDHSRSIAVVSGQALNDANGGYDESQRTILEEFSAADGKEDLYLVWSEEFYGQSLDNSAWVLRGGSSYSDERHVINDNTLKVENGNLVFGLEYDESDTRPYHNANDIQSAYSMQFQYGYLETRIKLPMTAGYYVAAWTLQDSVSHAEIDFVETYGQAEKIYPNLHLWNNGVNQGTYADATQYKPDKNLDGYTNYSGFNLSNNNIQPDSEGYYILGFEWSEDKMVYTINGEAYLTIIFSDRYSGGGQWLDEKTLERKKDARIDNPMYLIFGLTAISQVDATETGRPLVTDFTKTMNIDYIRLYQNENGILITQNN